MHLSSESKIICGTLLIVVPTIMYGGVTLLGILTEGVAGLAPKNLQLTDTQRSLWRAGHAHAGVIVILSLILQPLVDNTAFTNRTKWIARCCAPISSVVLPAGFFGVAFIASFKWIIYVGIILLTISVMLTGIGLLKNLRAHNT